MDLLRALALPFRTASLLFVLVSSLIAGLLRSVGGLFLVIAVPGLYVIAMGLTRYAFRMIEDAANGLREPAVLDLDMLHPFTDARCWVHPALTAGLVLLHMLNPGWPVAPTLIAVALLFPPSIAATVMHSRARDAFNPVAIGAVIRGLGAWYPLTVAATAALVLIGTLLTHWLHSAWLEVAAIELLLLLGCAFIGGAVYQRRFELGFAASRAPERKQAAAAHERDLRRQRVLDAVYRNLRVRETTRATREIAQWLQDAETPLLPADVAELVAAGRTWNEPREFPRMLRELAVKMVERRQPALGLQLSEAGLTAEPAFAPADEAATVAIAEHALRTGRRRTALRLLENFVRTLPAGQAPGPALTGLRETLGPQR